MSKWRAQILLCEQLQIMYRPNNIQVLKCWLFFYLLGDEALGGEKLGVKPGHFTENRKPTGFDIQQIFLSPSIRYVAHEAYAKPQQ